ncbi:unnamed protein product [Ilex paraguariensis]|uniref:Cation-transporting P-type ATPase C-terminal domain-containing protein n=1 Tax=Ilex paraguariensis TaxID=185542 RepID=A0ABC8TE66_9AQUA
MNRSPVRRNVSFITKAMWRNIFGQIIYQLAVLLVLNYDGKQLLRLKGSNAAAILKTFIFNTFVFCQLDIYRRRGFLSGTPSNHSRVPGDCCWYCSLTVAAMVNQHFDWSSEHARCTSFEMHPVDIKLAKRHNRSRPRASSGLELV